LKDIKEKDLCIDREDILLWKDMEVKGYTIKSYSKMQQVVYREDSEMYTSLWSIRVVPSTYHFVWKVLLNRPATKGNLRRRCIDVGNILCVLNPTFEWYKTIYET